MHIDSQAAELVIDGQSLTPAAVARVARGPAPSRVLLDPQARARIQASADLKRRLIADEQPIYGVTTGFGDSNIRQISPAKAARLQRNLITYHLNGTGPLAAPEVVRATLLIRANCLARGVSGVRPEVVELLLALLEADILPLIPERGSLGASGDLVPLCYLTSALIGEGEVWHRGRRRDARDALADARLRPVELEAKEGLALINGTSFMSAFAVLALHAAGELVAAADVCTALASEALLGNRGHFNRFIHAHKPHPGQVASAAVIAELLEDSGLADDHPQVLARSPALGERDFLELSHPIQDRYSVRCAPHVTGVLRDTTQWATRWLATEINSANDNPLFDASAGTVRSGGNFYGGHVAQAMDALKTAIANVADLLDRQLELVVDEKFNNGLTPNLIPRVADDDPQAGLHHGFKGMQIAASALTAEALKLTVPASVFSRSTEAHNQDKVSLGTIAARDARSVAELAEEVAAIHLHALCQAGDLRGCERLSPLTRKAYELVRARVPFVDADRRLDGDVAAIVDLIRSGALRQTVPTPTATSPSEVEA